MIQILPENLANQIAAGEVVERPASVVKELVENSLDAGATEVFIDVEKGGKRLIRVTDNGCGMSRDDAFLCLERHATSKIKSAADLFALHTMGFRGEALPAIASVSRFRLKTRTLTDDAGWQIYAEGGTIRQAEEVGLPAGSVIEVRDLFFNTPGRRKFLRKDETEFGHLAEVVTRLALARPDIHVRLSQDGRTFLEAYRHQRLEERAAALLGREMVASMVPVDSDSADSMLLTGLVGLPSLSRSSTGHLYTFVNGRFVRDRVVQHAVLEAYRTLLEKRRYPVAVLFFDLPADQVDVNVHPTKHEVRFRDQRLVHDFITAALRDRLRLASNPVAPLPAALPASTDAAIMSRPPHYPTVSSPAATAATERIQESLVGYAGRQYQGEPVRPVVSAKGEALRLPTVDKFERASEQGGDWRLIGQYLNSYLLCQVGDELLLIDQHAAHERIGFEKLKKQLAASGVEQQELLFPVVIDLDHREAALVAEHLDDFQRVGLSVEAFGGRSFTVTAVPQMLAEADAERLVRDVAAELADVGRSVSFETALDRLLILMACHGMIRANQALSRAEMDALLGELSRIDFASHCPHGRPVVKRLSRSEVERLFHRS